MGEPAKKIVEIRDFRGMASNYDPNDIVPGSSQLQININGLQRGQLEIRRGMRQVVFESDAGTGEVPEGPGGTPGPGPGDPDPGPAPPPPDPPIPPPDPPPPPPEEPPVPTPDPGANADWFVDSVDGNDSLAGTTEGSAFKTIAKVLSVLQNNQKVVLKRGSVFTQEVCRVQNFTDVTFDAYDTGNAPELDGENVEPISSDSLGEGQTTTLGLFEFRNCRECTVRNIKSSNSRSSGFAIRNDANPSAQQSIGNVIEYCHSYRARAYGIISTGKNHDSFPTAATQDQNPTIRYNIVEEACTAVTEGTGPNYSVGVAGGEAITINRAEGARVYFNNVFGYHKEGIVINQDSNNFIIYNNWVHDSDRIAYGNARGSGLYLDAASDGCLNGVVYGNIVSDDTYGIAFASEGGGTLDNHLIFNNIFFDNFSQQGAIVGHAGNFPAGGSGPQTNIRIFHNVFSAQKDEQEIFIVSSNVEADTRITGFIMAGNILHRGSGFGSTSVDMISSSVGTATMTVDTNLFFNDSEAISGFTGTNDTVADPVFVTAVGTGWPTAMTIGPDDTVYNPDDDFYASAAAAQAAIAAQGGVITDMRGRVRPAANSDYGPFQADAIA